MNILEQIFATYASFFDWQMWVEVLTDPVSWGFIGTLVIMEGLLSADNALVLAIMVKPLPKEQQKKALTYGLIGAYFFRFLFIGLGVLLIKFWWIKVIGSLYLAYLVYKHFKKDDQKAEAHTVKKDSWLVRTFGVFWATVISVEILGILMMRTVAKLFVTLIDKIPELENTAYILIALIAAKMFASVFGFELDHTLFFIIILMAFAATFVVHFYNKKHKKTIPE
jgi:predicted tellurium resistance membrane protein TerC